MNDSIISLDDTKLTMYKVAQSDHLGHKVDL